LMLHLQAPNINMRIRLSGIMYAHSRISRAEGNRRLSAYGRKFDDWGRYFKPNGPDANILASVFSPQD